MKHFIFNGKTYKEGDPVIGADNRGLRFGDGLFETIKCCEGRLQLADEHFARLWKGMQILQFNIPKHFTPAQLEEMVSSLCRKNGHEELARVRITVFRGDGGLFDATNHIPQYLVQTWELPPTNGDWNSNGLVIGIYPQVKKSNDILCNLKHNNFLPYVMAALHAKKNQWNDALILNTDGRACDTSIANIFIIKDEIVYTPPLSEAPVAGVMRKHIIQQLDVQGFGVAEKPISIDELLQANEVFLTNSIYTMRWVQRISNAVYGNDMSRKIYDAILPTIS